MIEAAPVDLAPELQQSRPVASLNAVSQRYRAAIAVDDR
jgi:hypothetical protein